MTTKEAPDLIVFVVPKKLSDGSKAFQVVIGDISLDAITEDDASSLAEGIAELVADHTNSECGVIYE